MMKKWLKKAITLITVFLMAVVLPLSISSLLLQAEMIEEEPSRQINLVYDDSGSMYAGAALNQELDTWAQAKYAMEAFAAFLGPEDTLDIYYLSDFDDNPQAEPRMQLSGMESGQTRINKIHNMKTEPGSTSFDAIKGAYADLEQSDAEQKWLVILTDGTFFKSKEQNADSQVSGDEMQQFFQDKDDDISVLYLAIGPEARIVRNDPDQGIYTLYAEDGSETLTALTDAANLIFSMERIQVPIESKEFSFDIPMSQLVVFAQGEGADVRSLDGPQDTYHPDESVEVKWSEMDAPNYKNKPVTSLYGTMATFKQTFEPGTYRVDVEEAQTIEVYFSPDIKVGIALVDSQGKEIPQSEQIEAGDYRLAFTMLSNTDSQPVNTDLLGEIDYSATIRNDERTIKVKPDQTFTLEEGDFSIQAQASFLDYRSEVSDYKGRVTADHVIKFEIEEDPTFTIVSGGEMQESTPFVIKALYDNGPMPLDIWQKMDLPSASFLEEDHPQFDGISVEKGTEPGEFIVTPIAKNEKITGGAVASEIPFKMEYFQDINGSSYSGSLESDFTFDDQRSWFEQNQSLLFWLILLGVVIALVLFYLLGYVFFKPRFSRKIAGKQDIYKTVSGRERGEYAGSFKKDMASVLIPFVSEKAEWTILPVDSDTSTHKLQLKALKKGGIEVLNKDLYDQKIYFNDNLAEEGEPLRIRPGFTVEVVEGKVKYSTTLKTSSKTQKKKAKRNKRRKTRR